MTTATVAPVGESAAVHPVVPVLCSGLAGLLGVGELPAFLSASVTRYGFDVHVFSGSGDDLDRIAWVWELAAALATDCRVSASVAATNPDACHFAVAGIRNGFEVHVVTILDRPDSSGGEG